jgi:hypothetical protein
MTDNDIIPWLAWCRSKGISPDTGLRLRAAGKGPRIVRIGMRRIGVTVKDDREWTRRLMTAK